MADTSRTQTPRKGARESKVSSGSDRAGSSRRGGRRGGRAGNNTPYKYTQVAEAPHAQNGNGTFDDSGNFVVDDSNTHKQSQRTLPKRNANVMKSSNANPATVDELPLSQSPFMSTPPKQYYAGPAFHQSPAASALPMPRFLSKSVPKAGKSAPSLLEHVESAASGESSSTTTPEPSPSASQAKPYPVAQSRQTDSPLDKLFEAARAEKVKQHRAVPQPIYNSPGAAAATMNSTSNHWASIYGSRPNHHRTASTDSSKGLFPMEMEGRQQTAASPAKNSAASLLSLHRTVSDGTQRIQQNRPGNHVYSAPGHSITNHMLPKPPLHNPGLAASQAPKQHSASHSPSPAQHTQTTPVHNQYATDVQTQPFHYGNKNLSPMFQAARTGSPRSQSSLRHQVGSEHDSQTHQQQPDCYHPATFQNHSYGSPMHHSATSTQQYHNEPFRDGRPSFVGKEHQNLNDSRTPPSLPARADEETAKMQALTDNLRSMLKIPRA